MFFKTQKPRFAIYLLVLIIIISSSAITFASENDKNWNMYFKNEKHTSKAEDRVMPNLERMWTSEAGFFGYNSAVISGNTVYAAEAVRGGELYAFDLESGELKWTYKIDDSGFPSKSPLVIDDTVYVGTSSGKIFAINDAGVQGELKWEISVDGGITAGITYYDESIYFTTDNGSLYSVGLLGNEKWSYDIGNNELSTPTIGDGRIFVSSGNGYLYSINIDSGTLDWKTKIYKGNYEIDGDFSTPIIQEENIFIAMPNGLIAVIDSDNGKLKKISPYNIEIDNKSGKAEVLSNGEIDLIKDGIITLKVILPDTDREFSFKLDIENSQDNSSDKENPSQDKEDKKEDKSRKNKDSDDKNTKNSNNENVDLNMIDSLIKNTNKETKEITIETDKDTVYLSSKIF